MATYRFPDSWTTEITDPTISVYECHDHWDGTCTIDIRLTHGSGNNVFRFPNKFTYASIQPTHALVEAWVLIEIQQYLL